MIDFLPKHGNRSEPPRFSLTSIGIKVIRAAAGANPCNFNILLPESRALELPATGRPQVEVILPYHKLLKRLWKNFLMTHKLCATWAKRGADSSQKV